MVSILPGRTPDLPAQPPAPVRRTTIRSVRDARRGVESDVSEEDAMIRIRAARVFTGTEMLTPGELVIEGEAVVGVGAPEDSPGELIDLGDVTLAPGYVDAHSHGGGGFSFVEDPLAAAALHRAHGTTSIVASLVTQSLDELDAQVRALAPLVDAGELAGIHLEGPWLSPAYKGAHPVDRLRDPAREEVDRLLDAGQGAVKMVTIAAEREGALDAIRSIVAHGAVAALGHSDCTYDQARAAIDAGVTGATHLFNAMPGLKHREPGPILALLEDPRVWCELIVDGVHLRPELAAWVMSFDPRIVLITDAMAAAGCADGDYVLGELPVEVKDAIAHIAGTDTIAGSTLTLDRGVANAIAAGVDPQAALAAATSHPAQYLGLAAVGTFAPGARADAVVLGDDWSVQRVLYRGAWQDAPAS